MHPKSMFVCNSDALLGIQLEGEFSGRRVSQRNISRDLQL
ncbi:MAG: hypothetical protein K0Q83_2646 [Deltaproteobacteria bacterium]|jgi:hypothetical protein|nr:hypothetical protein [Deltaproteobacteria bacterium]